MIFVIDDSCRWYGFLWLIGSLVLIAFGFAYRQHPFWSVKLAKVSTVHACSFHSSYRV
jgi:hypothetical protein